MSKGWGSYFLRSLSCTLILGIFILLLPNIERASAGLAIEAGTGSARNFQVLVNEGSADVVVTWNLQRGENPGHFRVSYLPLSVQNQQLSEAKCKAYLNSGWKPLRVSFANIGTAGGKATVTLKDARTEIKKPAFFRLDQKNIVGGSAGPVGCNTEVVPHIALVGPNDRIAITFSSEPAGAAITKSPGCRFLLQPDAVTGTEAAPLKLSISPFSEGQGCIITYTLEGYDTWSTGSIKDWFQARPIHQKLHKTGDDTPETTGKVKITIDANKSVSVTVDGASKGSTGATSGSPITLNPIKDTAVPPKTYVMVLNDGAGKTRRENITYDKDDAYFWTVETNSLTKKSRGTEPIPDGTEDDDASAGGKAKESKCNEFIGFGLFGSIKFDLPGYIACQLIGLLHLISEKAGEFIHGIPI